MEMPHWLDIAEFAMDSYRFEPGTKRAVDDGLITLRELTLYHYMNAWTNHNMPLIEHSGDNKRYLEQYEKTLIQTLDRAFIKGSEMFNISEPEARSLFYKVANTPRS